MNRKPATLIDNIPFTIDPVRVMREMKIPHLTALDQIEERPLAKSIEQAIARAYALIHGRGVYKTFDLAGVDGDQVRGPDTGRLFTGTHMVKLLGDSERATLLCCTIGPALEAEVAELQKRGDVTDAYSLEMVGGWMADYMADRVDERIEREIARAGFRPTMRFSPGYGDWSLDNQPQVLALIEAGRIGVELTESNIMTPRKSVSAVIGWSHPDTA